MPRTSPGSADAQLVDRLLGAAPQACPSCAHPLSPPLAQGRCPACRSLLVVRIGLVEPMTGSLITSFVALGAAFGFSAILTVYFAIVAAYHPMMRTPRFIVPVACGTLVSGAALGWLISRRGRTWLRRRDRPVRRAAVLVCLAVPVLVLAGFIAATR